MRSTQSNLINAEELESTILSEIPIAKSFDLKIKILTDNFIKIVAPVKDANINIHGTAFAGSLYSISALSAWGLVYSKILKSGINANLVISEATIKYYRPVNNEIVTETSFSNEEFDLFLRQLNEIGKFSLTTEVKISDSGISRAKNRVTLVAIKK